MTPKRGRYASYCSKAVAAISCVWFLLQGGAAFAFQFNGQALATLAQSSFGSAGQARFDGWLQMLNQVKGKPLQEQLRTVNLFWNSQVQDREDKVLWQREDYWATPLESLGKGAGDCEDFVIGKYFSLLWLGVPAHQLRLIYVNAHVLRQGKSQAIPHMVLGYYDSPVGQPLILDSLTDTIRSGNARPDLTPVFSFNAHGIYMPGAAPASVERIGRWRSLLARMRAQGFEP